MRLKYRPLKEGDVLRVGDQVDWATPLDGSNFGEWYTITQGDTWCGRTIGFSRRRRFRRPQQSTKTSKAHRTCSGKSPATFQVPIYNCEVTLAVTKDLRDVPFDISEEDREIYTNEDEANVFTGGHRLLVAFKPGCLSHDTITHELFHVTHYILSRANVRLTKRSDEAHAYLAGFVAKETYKSLKTITKERIK